MRLNDDGSISKVFDTTILDIPVQAIVLDVETVDPRFVEKPAPPLKEEFPIGSQVFFLGGLHYGSPAEVAGYNNGQLNLKILVLYDVIKF
jgi:5'-3' exoribonuclease 1